MEAVMTVGSAAQATLTPPLLPLLLMLAVTVVVLLLLLLLLLLLVVVVALAMVLVECLANKHSSPQRCHYTSNRSSLVGTCQCSSSCCASQKYCPSGPAWLKA
jgi:hypothetical protein